MLLTESILSSGQFGEPGSFFVVLSRDPRFVPACRGSSKVKDVRPSCSRSSAVVYGAWRHRSGGCGGGRRGDGRSRGFREQSGAARRGPGCLAARTRGCEDSSVENHPDLGRVCEAFYGSCSSWSNATGTPRPFVNFENEIGDTDCRDTSQQGIRRVGLRESNE
jgi:hypothetical protein